MKVTFTRITSAYQDESKNEIQIYQDNTNFPGWKQKWINKRNQQFTRTVQTYQVELKFTILIWTYHEESKNETKTHQDNTNLPGWKQKWDQQ
jgi:hypothetical protein